MKIVLVYNPKAGNALKLSELRTACKAHGLVIDRMIMIDDKLRKKLAPFVKKGALIVTYGGDGTLSRVAGMIAGTKAVFAPLPAGTLNHFTKDLGIPQNINAALKNLTTSKIKTVDVATVNGTVFINNSSIGLYPFSLRERRSFESYLGKWPAAVIAGVRTMVHSRTYRVTIEKETFRTPFIFVGNNIYEISNMGVAVRSRIDQGILSVFIVRTTSRWILLKIVLLVLIGKVHKLDEFEIRRVTSLTIETKHYHLSVSHDGEVSHMRSPLYYNIRSKALRLRY